MENNFFEHTDEDGKWLVCERTGARYLVDGFRAWYRKMKEKGLIEDELEEPPTPPNVEDELAI